MLPNVYTAILYCTLLKFIDRRNTLELERSFDNRLQPNGHLLALAAAGPRGQHGAPYSSFAGQGAPWVSPWARYKRRGACACPLPPLPCLSRALPPPKPGHFVAVWEAKVQS